MKLNEFMNILKTCSVQKRFAILKSLQKNKKLTYKGIKILVGVESRPIFGYHLRVLKRHKIVQKNEYDFTYSLTGRGKSIISFIEDNLEERFMSDESGGACSNSKDKNHQFITVCVNCSYTKEDEK